MGGPASELPLFSTAKQMRRAALVYCPTAHVHASSAPLRPAPGHRPQHDQHDRDRPVHHDPAVDERARRPPGHARLDRRARHRDLRRHGLERARRRDAGPGRIVRLSARGVRPRDVRPPDGVPVRVAVHPERAARDRLRLHRLLAVPRLHLARVLRPLAVPGRRRRRPRQHRAALPPHHVDRDDHRQLVGRHAPDHGRRDCDRR